MVKYFCDICGNEIEKNELVGSFRYFQRNLGLLPQKQKELPSEISWIMCERCMGYAKDYLDGQRNINKIK